MASNFASQMGNSSGFAPVKFSGFRIPGVGVAHGVVACGALAASGGALAGSGGVTGGVIVVPVLCMKDAYLSYFSIPCVLRWRDPIPPLSPL